MKKKCANIYKNGDDISQKGYRDNSPYKNAPYLPIKSKNKTIDMSETGQTLIGIDENGYRKEMPPYSGLHKFTGKNILEIPKKSLVEKKPWEHQEINPNAGVYPYEPYTPKVSKFGIVEPIDEGLLGVAGIGFPRKGLSADLVGIKPWQNDPYYKGLVEAGISKQFGDLNVRAAVASPITGAPDRDGKFKKGKSSFTPSVKLKYNLQNGGLVPKATYTKDQLDEYQTGYEGDIPFMDRFYQEYDDMHFFPIQQKDGSIHAYETADISEAIIEHGYTPKKLAKMLGTDVDTITNKFQPVFDYHAAEYDMRGKRYITELMNQGFTKQGAFNYLIDKKDFGTKDGLERIFGEHADKITARKVEAEKALEKLVERQKELEDKEPETKPELITAWDSAPTSFSQAMDPTVQATLDAQTKPYEEQQREIEKAIFDVKREYSKNQLLYNQIGIDLDDYVGEDGDYDWLKLGQKITSPEFKKQKVANFKKQEQAAWDALPWYQKAAQGTMAFLDDPVLTGANWMEGKGPMVGQEAWLSDPEKAQQVANQYGISIEDLYKVAGDSDSYLNDIFKFINPAHYATQSGIDLSEASDAFEQGEVLEGLGEMGMAGLNMFAAVTGAEVPTSFPTLASAKQLGVGQIFKGKAKPQDLFKRQDLIRLTGKETLDELKTKLATGKKIDPSDAMWNQALKNNPELAKYAAQQGDKILAKVTPLTKAAASQYSLPNLIKTVEKGKKLPKGITKEAVEDAAAKTIPSKAQVAKDPILKDYFLKQPLETRLKMNEMMSQPASYWYTPTWAKDLGLQSTMKNKQFINYDEFLLPRTTSGFQPVAGGSLQNIPVGTLLTRPVLEAEKRAVGETSKRSLARSSAESENSFQNGDYIEGEPETSGLTLYPGLLTKSAYTAEKAFAEGTEEEQAAYKESLQRRIGKSEDRIDAGRQWSAFAVSFKKRISTCFFSFTIYFKCI
jgi:hypothetical protein